ncbi:MAG: hypothetical protein AAGB05_02925 [Pseudomonadota bacterium]
MKDTQEEPQGGGNEDPEITLIAVANETFYIVEGEEHLDEMLIVDGTYPTPILMIHFDTVQDIHAKMGETINMAQYWTIHPKIIARLRDDKLLIEKVA